MVSLSVLCLFLLYRLIGGCYVTECASDLAASTCFVNDTSHQVLKIKECSSSEKCQIDRTSSTQLYDFSASSYGCVSSDWLPGLKYPGEICRQSSECGSGQCSSNGKCAGLSQGQPCSVHGDCDVGLVCLGGVSRFCTAQVSERGHCESDEECVNSCLCYNRQCTKYLTVPTGSTIGYSSSSLLCTTGYASRGVCSEAPKNSKAADDPCYSYRDCKTVFPDGKTDLTNCLCGLNDKGFAYCQAVAGDDEFQPFAQGLSAIASVNNKCHFDTAFSARCPELSADSQFHSFINSYYIYIYRHMLIGAPSCAAGIMPFINSYGDYSLISDSSGNSSDKTIIIVVVVCVFAFLVASGVVCFLCVRRCAREEYYHEEITRRRMLRQDMEELVIREGRVIHKPEGLLDPASKFTTDDLGLDQKDKRFLKQGIPIAIPVHQRTFEVDMSEIGHIEQASALSAAGATVIAVELDASAHTPPSTLFQRSSHSSSRN